jgi:2-polyprenyl-6-hydroxyphenyl methylase/3-demethylubiquinone-9 3-methyltransferase
MNNHEKNVDNDEINHFAQMADEWWNPKGKLRTLHEINPARMAFILKHTALVGKKVLDVGCGGGILSEALTKEGAQVLGIDLENNAIQAAKSHAEAMKLDTQYKCVAVESLLETSERYDVITCMEMLEHVPHPEPIIQSCASLLKPGGKLFVSTINKTLKAYLSVIVGAEYLLRLVPKHTHQYEKFIRPSQVVEWMRQNHLTVQAFAGMDYNPCLHQASLSENVEVNYLVVAGNSFA